ncbi:MAG: DNA-binding transcriptional regulator Lrp family [Candidatus Methanohalarchaeum thermophilum]|uniref:DNA-binding transcriptional regulator Lrp family n=1 Tax=Methanohalarchaeum thermophilum TaxID=1903181 RepID=A0A1Q6DU85_METT1|nr:MAG: DNA-binding transcriptional regulator Lrp family [Candidatus Methanohalarchaeum thermophilum]
MEIDEIDLKILQELQCDARKSYRKVAKNVNVAEGTVYNRIEKLKENGVIKGFIPDIDYSELGFNLIAIIGVSAEGGFLPDIEEKIAKKPNVTSVYDVTGEYDAIVVVKFKERKEMNKFVKDILSMERVERTNTMLALNVVKESHKIDLSSL